jgi:hypothetical protein
MPDKYPPPGPGYGSEVPRSYPRASTFTNGTKHPTNERMAGKNYEQFQFSSGAANPSIPVTTPLMPPQAATSSSSPQNASRTQVPVFSNGIAFSSISATPWPMPPQAATSSSSPQNALRYQEDPMRPTSDPFEEDEATKKKRKGKNNARRRVSGANAVPPKTPALRKETRNYSAHEAVSSSGAKQPKISARKGGK